MKSKYDPKNLICQACMLRMDEEEARTIQKLGMEYKPQQCLQERLLQAESENKKIKQELKKLQGEMAAWKKKERKWGVR